MNFNVVNLFGILCTVKLKLSFLKTYDKFCIVYENCSIFLVFWKCFQFQGSHNWAKFVVWIYMATLKIKSDPIILKGMPYVARTSRYDFKIPCMKWAKYQLNMPYYQNPCYILFIFITVVGWSVEAVSWLFTKCSDKKVLELWLQVIWHLYISLWTVKIL